jgi:hypothetical protein
MRSRRLSTVRNREPDPEKVSVYADLASLTQHPGWPTLVRVIEDEIDALRRLTIANTLHGDGPVNTDAIQQSRGFLKGVRYILKVAGGAERNLEAELQKRTTEEAS